MPQNDELHVDCDPEQALPVEILQPMNMGVGELRVKIEHTGLKSEILDGFDCRFLGKEKDYSGCS